MADITHGANVEELRQLARHFREAAERIAQIVREITARVVENDIWTGKDADEYREHWERQKRWFDRLVEWLRERAERLEEDIREQEEASGQ